jgi:hypothetical protein
MKFVRKLFKHQNFWPIVIVVFVAILAGRTLLAPGYFRMHDDLQMMRQLEMEKCFLDLQIPCRWVPDMGYGYGFPLFNYYPPLPYLVGELFRLISFSFVDTVKIVFLLSFIFSGISMYFFSKEFFGKVGGILSSIFYIWAPYHAVDVYVRGAMNEAWAFVWFPLILWTGYKLLKSEKRMLIKWIIGLALSWAGLLLSHNLMVLIFTPVFGVWILFFLLKEKNWGKIISLVKSGALALGLTAFFTLPAILEQKYVQVDTLVNGYYEYIAHFASFGQIFLSRFWGYGPSAWGLEDQMSFQIGHIHWILSLIILILVLINIIKNRKKTKIVYFVILFFVIVGWFAAFMVHSKSTFIWQLIPILKFVQFPWRFLTLVTFSFSFIVGSLVLFVPKKFVYWVIGVLSVGLIVFNWNYFLPYNGKMGPLTDKEKFAGEAWNLQIKAGILDYLPKGAITDPKEPRRALFEVMKGEVNFDNLKEGINKASISLDVISNGASLRIGIFKFPNWTAYVDGKKIETYIPKDEMWGRMYLDVPKGEHKINLKLLNTSLRLVTNIISLITWVGLVSFLLRKKKINGKAS